MFNHNPLPNIELPRDESSGKRLYVTPDGKKYPSVTSVVGFDSKDFLTEWVAKVGKEEANAISNRAAKRGTAIHAYSEDYLNNKIVTPNMFDMEMWKSFRPLLDRIDNIRMLEGRMFSHRLQLAGTVDCLAEYDGVLSVIDFKTSKSVKREDWIQNYFLQCTAYGCMAQERFDILPKQIVVLIAVDDNPPQIFIKKTWDYVPKLLDTIRRYKLSIHQEK